jgi:hypothetical protein
MNNRSLNVSPDRICRCGRFPAIALMLTFGLICVTSTAWAGSSDADDAESDHAGPNWVQELTLGNTPVPQEQGEFQVSVIASHFEFDGSGRQSEAGLEVEYGLSDRLQIGAEIFYAWQREDDEEQVDGLTDLEVGVLYNFVATETFLFSASLNLAFPTGDENKGLGGGSVTYEPGISAAFAVGALQLFASVAAELGSGDDSLSYGAAVALPFEDWAPIVELAGEVSQDESELYVVPAMAWRPAGDWELLVGVPIGLTDDSADIAISIKLTFEH